MPFRLIAAMSAAALAAGAIAQPGAHNPATKDPTAKPVAMAAPGRNSFTEDQARGRLEKAGYTAVSKLAKDREGVWRGTASKGGAKVAVGLDYKGNVTTR